MEKKPFIARHQQISENMMATISSGVWNLGDQLPSEQALAEEYGVSRFTVRSALDDLQKRGMISRRRRFGTIVIAQKPVELIVQEIQSVEELFQYPENTKLEVIKSSNIVADVSLASFLQCDVGSEWTKIETIRNTSKKVPLCLTEIYVPRIYKNIRNLIGKSNKPAFKLLEDHFDVRALEIHAEVLAGSLSNERADLLGVESKSPSLIMVRRYRDQQGLLLEVSVSEHPASRFSYSFNLSYRR